MFRETRIIFTRAMRLSVRSPAWVIIGLIQPIVYLAFFGPLLKQVAQTPGFPEGDAWQVFVPGILVQLGIFGSLFVGFGLVAEWRSGVIERMRVTPASRAALLMGRVLRDVVVLLVQASMLTGIAMFFGLDASAAGIAIGLVTVALLGAAFSSVSYAVALTVKDEDPLAAMLNTVALPVMLLSGIMLPMTLAPHWLRVLSDINPLKHVVDGVRALFRGDLATSDTYWGFGLTIGLVAAALLVGTTVFRRQSA